MTEVHIITWAQVSTRVHPEFWQGLLQCKKHRRATLHVVGGRYKNPTSLRASRDAQAKDRWCKEVTPYITRQRVTICRNLKLYADIPIQPTASRPLSSFEVYLGRTSGIFGHPKRALEMVPTDTRTPRTTWTTSACTLPNYSDSKAGKKGRAHHVLGALIVEVDPDGTYFARHISADSKGCFTDLDTYYTPEGPQKARPALTLTLGDYHAGRENEAVLQATERLAECVRPRYGMLHDLLDFSARNHHHKTHEDKFDHRYDSVEEEMGKATGALKRVSKWCEGSIEWVEVRSNHDEAFERWLSDNKVPDNDQVNATYWKEVGARRDRIRMATGQWPNAFALEAKRLGCPKNVRFLNRNESFYVGGVEHGFHGDKGLNGSRGSWQTYVKLGVKTTCGHTHQPKIADGYYCVGTSSELDHDYNLLPACWAHAHVVLHADGKRQLIFITNGRFRGGMQNKIKRAA